MHFLTDSKPNSHAMIRRVTKTCMFFKLSTSFLPPDEIQTCDGAERKVMGARLVAGEIRGSVECRYAPQAPQYAMAITFNKLNLAGAEGACSSLKIIGKYSVLNF